MRQITKNTVLPVSALTEKQPTLGKCTDDHSQNRLLACRFFELHIMTMQSMCRDNVGYLLT
jgi:hypothetical protein